MTFVVTNQDIFLNDFNWPIFSIWHVEWDLRFRPARSSPDDRSVPMKCLYIIFAIRLESRHWASAWYFGGYTFKNCLTRLYVAQKAPRFRQGFGDDDYNRFSWPGYDHWNAVSVSFFVSSTLTDHRSPCNPATTTVYSVPCSPWSSWTCK